MKFGIVGLGVMGKNHLRVLQKIQGVQILGICDPMCKEDLGFRLFGSIEDMLKAETFDAIIIAVPTFLHKEVAIKCMEKGINLLIEKPVAQDLPNANEILKAQQKFGVKTCIGYIERFNPVVIALKESLKSSQIYNISITRIGPIPPRITDVGILTDLSVHDIDLIRYISGKEILQKNIFTSQKIHSTYEDNAILSFLLEDEITASITTNWLTPFKKRTITVATKDKYFEADLMNQTLSEYSSFQGTDKLNSYVKNDVFIQKQEPLLNELLAFVDFVQTSKTSALASIQDSIKTIEISSK